MKILVLIPAFNEEQRIGDVISKIIINKKVDILVVNDGSNDNTALIVKKFGVFLVNHPYNLGYGVAIQTGYKFALENNYDLVVQMDADGQHDPKYIQEMVDVFVEKHLDVLVGSRFKNKTGYHASFTRRLGMYFFSILVGLVTKRKVTDSTSGYQVIGKQVLPFLCSDLFPCDYPDADLLIMLYFAGYKVEEIPMIMFESKTGKSMHGSIIKNIYYVLKMCLSIFTIMLRKITGLSNR